MITTLHALKLFSGFFIFLSAVCHADSGSDRKTSLPGDTACSNSPVALFAAAIIDFSLVDAATDEHIALMKFGGIIDPELMPNFTIRGNEYDYGFEGLWITFTLTGTVSRTWTERQPPYALFGDTEGDYNRADLSNGSYHLLAVATVKGGEIINSREIDFTVGPDTNEVIAFNSIYLESYYDQSEYEEGSSIKNGQEFDADDSPFDESTSILAHTNSYATGSVVFSLTGPITVTRTENLAPFSLFGDMEGDNGGVFSAGTYIGQIFPNGTYTLTATPYRMAGGRGLKGISRTIQFTIAHFPDIELTSYLNVEGFDDNQNYGNIYDSRDNVIDLKDYDGSFTLVAHSSYDSGPIGSVLLLLEGPVPISKTEAFEPYALFGDIDYNYNRGTLAVGSYTIRTTPYTGPNRTGLAGPTILYDFEVIDTRPISPAGRTAGPEVTQAELKIFPNPAVSDVSLSWEPQDPVLKATIYDFSGVRVMKVPGSRFTERSIDVSALKKGMYFIEIETATKKQTKRLVVN